MRGRETLSNDARNTITQLEAKAKEIGCWVSYQRHSCHLTVWRGTDIRGTLVLGRFTGRVKQVYARAEKAQEFVSLLDGLLLEPEVHDALVAWETDQPIKSKGFDAPEVEIVAAVPQRRRKRRVRRSLI